MSNHAEYKKNLPLQRLEVKLLTNPTLGGVGTVRFTSSVMFVNSIRLRRVRARLPIELYP